jgi:anti-sigma factor RsiW
MMKMKQHIDELLPFYVNQTLNEKDIALVHLHLKTCAECRQELELWEEIADVTAAVDRPSAPSHLSPLVHGSPSRRPSSPGSASALHLIWSQRVFIAAPGFTFGWQSD